VFQGRSAAGMPGGGVRFTLLLSPAHQPTVNAEAVRGGGGAPLRRLGEVSDLVGTAIFLASEASAFLTGQVLYVDGGFTCGLAWPIDFDKQ